MNGQELYEEFKVALNYLDVGFRGMAEVKVQIDGGKLRLTANGRECLIDPTSTPELSRAPTSRSRPG